MGGGGSSSGEIDYPDYMEEWHAIELINVAADMIGTRASDPYLSAAAYDPTAHLDLMGGGTSDFEAVIDGEGFDAAAAWILAFNAALAVIPTGASLSSDIAAEVAAFTNDHDAERNDVILPRFKAGMTDVNAVMTSAFVIGQSILEAYGARDVTRFNSSLTEKAFLQEERHKVERSRIAAIAGDSALVAIGMKLDAEKALMHYKTEIQRINIDTRRTRTETDLEIDASSAIWDLETYSYGSNMLAAIGSGTSQPISKGPSRTQAAVGGALSGAAAGAMVTPANPAMGAAIGAAIGGIGGLIASG